MGAILNRKSLSALSTSYKWCQRSEGQFLRNNMQSDVSKIIKAWPFTFVGQWVQ